MRRARRSPAVLGRSGYLGTGCRSALLVGLSQQTTISVRPSMVADDYWGARARLCALAAWLACPSRVLCRVGGTRPRSACVRPAVERRATSSGRLVAIGRICCDLPATRCKLLFVTDSALTPLLDGLRPYIPLFVVVGVFLILLASPLPGRGPRMFQRRDPWRGFKFAARRAVMTRAGGRCEAPMLLGWGRCHDAATEVDHIYPWSRGGPTVVSNGQALCRAHNRRKSNLRPPWWYVLSLERRRNAYSPPDVTVRVFGRMSAVEWATRAARKQ